MKIENNPYVSIIMPVYNSEQYVAEAIQSVMKQTYRDFELIIVDDGSTDNSGVICDELAKNDSRIIVYHKQNGGCCAARNFALGKCRGEFITFIDNDDYYEDNFLEVLVNGIKDTNADTIKCGNKFISVDANGNVTREVTYSYKGLTSFTKDDISKNYLELFKNNAIRTSWNSLYRRSIINEHHVEFDETLKHGQEDVRFNCYFNKWVNSMIVLPDVLYIHFIRMGHSVSSKTYVDLVEAYLENWKLHLQFVDGYKEQRDVVMIQGIHDTICMATAFDWKDYQALLCKIRNTLDFSVLKRYPLISSKRLGKKSKISLLFVKYKLFWLFYISRRVRKR